MNDNPARYAGALFRDGHYERAWAVYSHRESDFWGSKGRTISGVGRWYGQPVRGKRLLLTYEQAIGEQVLFSSMLSELVDMGAKVTVEVDSRLVGLLSRSFPHVQVIPYQNPWHKAVFEQDYHCLMGNVGKVLRNSPESFPKVNLGYIKPPLLPWGEPIADRRVVGFAWYTPAEYGDYKKSIEFKYLSPILEDKRLVCMDLQCFPAESHPNLLKTDHINKFNDLEGLAFLVSQCDKVITVSTFVAHLASAMGKTTYVLLRDNPKMAWYWRVPFYPNATRIYFTDDNLPEKIAEISKKVVDF